MRLMRFIGSAWLAGVMSLALAGAAQAADDVTLDTTGPNSNQSVTVDNSAKVEVTNNNNVQIQNTNLQEASTGDVSAKDNTDVSGGLGSGNANNNSATTTSVSISNGAPVAASGGGQGSGNVGSGAGGGSTGSTGGFGGSSPAGSGGSALGASTTGGFGSGEATLPEVGASSPVDVSALRAAWHPPQASAAARQLAQRSQAISAVMLATAAALSLLGAVLSSVYAKRKERRA